MGDYRNTDLARVVVTVITHGAWSCQWSWGLPLVVRHSDRLLWENASFLLVGIALLGLFVIVAATENRRYQISVVEKRAMEHLTYIDSDDSYNAQ